MGLVSKMSYEDVIAILQKAKKVKNLLKNTNFNILEWPAKFPNLNIVEDVWGRIPDIVYDGPQFRNNKELLKKIDQAIYKLCTEEKHKLLELYAQIRSTLFFRVYPAGYTRKKAKNFGKIRVRVIQRCGLYMVK